MLDGFLVNQLISEQLKRTELLDNQIAINILDEELEVEMGLTCIGSDFLLALEDHVLHGRITDEVLLVELAMQYHTKDLIEGEITTFLEQHMRIVVFLDHLQIHVAESDAYQRSTEL